MVTSRSILVVDDNDGMRSMLKSLLLQAGHTVTCAKGGNEAIQLLAAGQFDLLVTDVVMPDGDGLGLILRVRKSGSHLPIVAISGGGYYLPSNDCVQMAKGIGANAYLLKPFTPSGLAEAIGQALAPQGAA